MFLYDNECNLQPKPQSQKSFAIECHLCPCDVVGEGDVVTLDVLHGDDQRVPLRLGQLP